MALSRQNKLIQGALTRGYGELIQRGYKYDPAYFDAKMRPFNPDPSDGNQDCFPISNSTQSFQNITIQGSAVLELTTGSGMFIWLPAWVEKIMVWHIPTDNITKTFGTAGRIDYSIDADQFYERYRMLTGTVRIQAGTVSVTNAALAGNINGVSAYNSLASLTGNNSTVFQIYSYENAPGLSPDVECKIIGIPSWNGVSMLYVNDPDSPVQRLEDSVVAIGVGAITAKFVNNSDNYDLNTGYALADSERAFSLPPNVTQRINLGRYLKDAIRASSIDWVFNTDILFTASGAGNLDRNKLQITIGYELKDITETTVITGIMYTDQFLLPTTAPVSSLGYPFTRCGSMPDNLNVDENFLVPPIREFTWYIELRNLSTIGLEVDLRDAKCNVRYPIINGLTQGIIQEPKLVFYTGAEIGTKMSVSGSVRLEAYPDATRSKFVSNIRRSYDPRQADAIKKVLCNPLDYGVRWAMPAANYQNIIDSFTNGLIIALEDEPERQFLALMNQIMDAVNNHYMEQADGTKKSLIHEASLRSLSKKALKSLKKVGSDVYHSTIKPVLEQEWEVIKALPATAAKQMLTQTFGPVIQESYTPPKVSYYSQPNNVVTVSSPNKIAASGYIAGNVDLRKHYNACVYEIFPSVGAEPVHFCVNGRKDSNYNSFLREDSSDFVYNPNNITMSYQTLHPCDKISDDNKEIEHDTSSFDDYDNFHYAATKMPKQTTKILDEDICESCDEQFEIPFNKCNVFATVNIKQGKLVQDGNHTVADGFAIVPKSLINSGDIEIPVYKIGQRKIYNYSSYSKDTEVLKVTPNVDVCLMRIVKVCPLKGTFLLEFTKKPVGGRSLELALYMFNNGIHGLCCFTGALEAGKILPMFDSMALIKSEWCHKNHIITIGNGKFDISCDTVVGLLTLMRRMTVTNLSPNHHNAATSHMDLRNLPFKEFKELQQYLTPSSVVTFLPEEYPVIVDHFFSNTQNVIYVANINKKLPGSFTKYIPLNVKNDDATYDAYFLPSISTQHSITKHLLQHHWIAPLPLMTLSDFETNNRVDEGVPMAMDSLPVISLNNDLGPNLNESTGIYDNNGNNQQRQRTNRLTRGRGRGGMSPFRPNQQRRQVYQSQQNGQYIQQQQQQQTPVYQDNQPRRIRNQQNMIVAKPTNATLNEDSFRNLLKQAKGSFNNDILKEADRIWIKIVNGVFNSQDEALKSAFSQQRNDNVSRSDIASFIRGYKSNKFDETQTLPWKSGFNYKQTLRSSPTATTNTTDQTQY